MRRFLNLVLDNALMRLNNTFPAVEIIYLKSFPPVLASLFLKKTLVLLIV